MLAISASPGASGASITTAIASGVATVAPSGSATRFVSGATSDTRPKALAVIGKVASVAAMEAVTLVSRCFRHQPLMPARADADGNTSSAATAAIDKVNPGSWSSIGDATSITNPVKHQRIERLTVATEGNSCEPNTAHDGGAQRR